MCFSPARVITENIQKINMMGGNQMFGPLDKMFDLDGNGRLDTLEKAGRAAFLTHMLEEEEKKRKNKEDEDDD